MNEHIIFDKMVYMDVMITMLLLHVQVITLLLTVNDQTIFDKMVTMDVVMTVLLLNVRVLCLSR